MATFAQRAQSIINKYDMRPGDSASENAKNAELKALKEAQELARQDMAMQATKQFEEAQNTLDALGYSEESFVDPGDPRQDIQNPQDAIANMEGMSPEMMDSINQSGYEAPGQYEEPVQQAKYGGKLSKIRKRPGMSNAGKYPNVKDFAGKHGTYPMNTIERGRAALGLAYHSENEEEIKANVYAKYPSLRPDSNVAAYGGYRRMENGGNPYQVAYNEYVAETPSGTPGVLSYEDWVDMNRQNQTLPKGVYQDKEGLLEDDYDWFNKELERRALNQFEIEAEDYAYGGTRNPYARRPKAELGNPLNQWNPETSDEGFSGIMMNDVVPVGGGNNQIIDENIEEIAPAYDQFAPTEDYYPQGYEHPAYGAIAPSVGGVSPDIREGQQQQMTDPIIPRTDPWGIEFRQPLGFLKGMGTIGQPTTRTDPWEKEQWEGEQIADPMTIQERLDDIEISQFKQNNPWGMDQPGRGITGQPIVNPIQKLTNQRMLVNQALQSLAGSYGELGRPRLIRQIAKMTGVPEYIIMEIMEGSTIGKHGTAQAKGQESWRQIGRGWRWNEKLGKPEKIETTPTGTVEEEEIKITPRSVSGPPSTFAYGGPRKDHIGGYALGGNIPAKDHIGGYGMGGNIPRKDHIGGYAMGGRRKFQAGGYPPEFEEAINAFIDVEEAGSASGPAGYVGGGSNFGTNDPSMDTREKAIKHYYDMYWSEVKDLPPGMRTRALQLAINTGDPYGELLVASGDMSIEERIKLKDEATEKGLKGYDRFKYITDARKKSLEEVDDQGSSGLDKLLTKMKTDPMGFAESLDKEQQRYYNKGIKGGNVDQEMKDFWNNYYGTAGDIASGYYQSMDPNVPNLPEEEVEIDQRFDPEILKKHPNLGRIIDVMPTLPEDFGKFGKEEEDDDDDDDDDEEESEFDLDAFLKKQKRNTILGGILQGLPDIGGMFYSGKKGKPYAPYTIHPEEVTAPTGQLGIIDDTTASALGTTRALSRGFPSRAALLNSIGNITKQSALMKAGIWDKFTEQQRKQDLWVDKYNQGERKQADYLNRRMADQKAEALVQHGTNITDTAAGTMKDIRANEMQYRQMMELMQTGNYKIEYDKDGNIKVVHKGDKKKKKKKGPSGGPPSGGPPPPFTI